MLALAFKQENPKRKGTKSFHRYEAYKSAKNVSEYAKKNKDPSYTNADLRNDIGVGLVSCEGGWDAAKQALAVVFEAPGPVLDGGSLVEVLDWHTQAGLQLLLDVADPVLPGNENVDARALGTVGDPIFQ